MTSRRPTRSLEASVTLLVLVGGFPAAAALMFIVWSYWSPVSAELRWTLTVIVLASYLGAAAWQNLVLLVQRHEKRLAGFRARHHAVVTGYDDIRRDRIPPGEVQVPLLALGATVIPTDPRIGFPSAPGNFAPEERPIERLG